MWQALSDTDTDTDTDTVMSIHIGSSGRLAIPAVDSPPDVMITLQPINLVSAAGAAAAAGR